MSQGPGAGAGGWTIGHESRQSWQLHAASIPPPALGSGLRIGWLHRLESYELEVWHKCGSHGCDDCAAKQPMPNRSQTHIARLLLELFSCI